MYLNARQGNKFHFENWFKSFYWTFLQFHAWAEGPAHRWLTIRILLALILCVNLALVPHFRLVTGLLTCNGWWWYIEQVREPLCKPKYCVNLEQCRNFKHSKTCLNSTQSFLLTGLFPVAYTLATTLLWLSRLVTKPAKWQYAQRRLRSAWASAQSDQRLRFALNGWLRIQAFFMRTTKTLIRLIWVFAWRTTTLLLLSWGGSC